MARETGGISDCYANSHIHDTMKASVLLISSSLSQSFARFGLYKAFQFLPGGQTSLAPRQGAFSFHGEAVGRVGTAQYVRVFTVTNPRHDML